MPDIYQEELEPWALRLGISAKVFQGLCSLALSLTLTLTLALTLTLTLTLRSGHRCRSGFVASAAEASSVSFDFRVIPWSIYREDRAAAKRSNHSLRLGGYYAVMERAGVQGGQGASEPGQT